METKICKTCKENRPIDQFSNGNTYKGKTYLYPHCKECDRKRVRALGEANKKRDKPVLQQKICSSCKQTLPIENFWPASTKDGFYVWCKKCKSSFDKEKANKYKNSFKPVVNGKICSTCKTYKSSESFCKNRSQKDGLDYNCKECVKINKIKYRTKIIETEKTKRHKNPVYRLVIRLRKRTRDAVKSGSKSAHTLKLLGCTGAECMDYLETLFWPGMTRDNYGKKGWVADHIIPIDNFDKTDPQWQFKAFHYTNLQPLWHKDNSSKKARLDWTPAESKYELPERLKSNIINPAS